VLTDAKVRPVAFRAACEAIDELGDRMDSRKYDLRKVDARVRVFFHPDTLRQILWIREYLANDRSQTSTFLKALMCGILHGSSRISLSVPCSHAFSMTPSYVQRYMETRGLHKVRKDALSCLRAKAIDSLSDPLPSQLGMAMMKDARKLPIEDESVDMIFTSPPYFEMQTYARDNWLRLWFLGYDHNEVKKWQMRTSSRERFLEFMRDCMQEMYRVLKDDSSCFVVIGDVTCNDHVVNGSNLLAKVSKTIGFKVDRIIVDSVPRAHKYFMFIPRSQGIRRDRIMELHKGRVRERDTDPGWDDPYRGHLKQTVQRL
jgi:hypothetical protein